jgi:hypothetical protein
MTTTEQDAAKATMTIVQEKLQQCVNSGQMNSFDRLSNLFAGDDINKPAPTDEDVEDDDVDMIGTGTRNESLSVGKDESKIPMKKSKSKSSKHISGQYGDKTPRKMGERKSRNDRTSGGSSRGRSLEGRRFRSSSKKGSGKKLATV